MAGVSASLFAQLVMCVVVCACVAVGALNIIVFAKLVAKAPVFLNSGSSLATRTGHTIHNTQHTVP